MKIIIRFFNLLVFTNLLWSCSNRPYSETSCIQVNVENGIKNMEVVNLSDFTDKIDYISLQTNKETTLGYVDKVDISDNLILISDMNNCLLFDLSGNYITRYGRKGRGPGEYPYITNIRFGSKKKVWLSDYENLYEFQRDGSFVNKYLNGVLINEEFSLQNWIPVCDSLFLGNIPNNSGQNRNKAIITNSLGHIKYSFKNYIFFNRKKVISGPDNHANIYYYKQTLYFKELNNDTLFYLSDKLNLIPTFAFNLGNLKEPVSERENFKFDDHMLKYIYMENTFQTDGFLFLDCNLGDHFSAKRLSEKKFPFPTIKPILTNTQNALGIYSIKKGSLVFCEPTSTDNPLYTTGLYNDIDGGPRFYPAKQVNDSTLAMWVTAKDLKDHIASVEFKNSIPKYPAKKKQLQDLADRLTENDNSVLMFVTFKKNGSR